MDAPEARPPRRRVPADEFLARVSSTTGPVIAVTHDHMSSILAVRAIGLSAWHGGVLGSATGSLSMVEEHRGRPELSLWNSVARRQTT